MVSVTNRRGQERNGQRYQSSGTREKWSALPIVGDKREMVSVTNRRGQERNGQRYQSSGTREKWSALPIVGDKREMVSVTNRRGQERNGQRYQSSGTREKWSALPIVGDKREMVSVTNRRGRQERMKPNLIRDYNEGMPGIDRSDQMLSYHSSLRKTLRWYKKIGVHFVEMLMVNAHFFCKKYSPSSCEMRVNTFLEEVVRSLNGEPRRPAYVRPRAAFHYIGRIPQTGKKEHPQKPCRRCKPRKDRRYMCMFCAGNPSLCLEPCFSAYHIELGIVEDAVNDNEDDDQMDFISFMYLL